MGRFYDMFYKREPVQDVVHVTLPPGFATPHGYGALMSIDFAACEQTKARSMASLPFSVMQAGATATSGSTTTRWPRFSTAWPTRR